MEQLTQLAAIGGTISLLWLTLEGLRRLRSNNAATQRVQVQQRVSLANGCQLVVIQWDGREILLATGNHPCSVLAAKPATEAVVQAETGGVWAH